jgi:diguanylate cyclase (GGDEF)-like protein/PAS domain S-box-containing protein
MAEHRSRTHSILRSLYRNPWLVVFVGLLVTSLLFFEIRKAAVDDFRSRFEAGSIGRGTRVIHEMNEVLSVMQALSQFVLRADKVDGHEFRVLATPFLQARSDLKALGWVPATNGIRSGFSGSKAAPGEMVPRRASHGGSKRSPPETAPLQDEPYRISLAEPVDLKGEMEGVDLGAEPRLRPILERARDTGQTAACTWMAAEKGNRQPELLILLPAYEQGRAPASEGERRAAIRGFLVGLVNIDPVMAYIFSTVQPDGLTVEFFDLSAGKQGIMLYSRSLSAGGVTSRWIGALLPSQSPFLFKAAFGGHEWGIRVIPSRGYIRKYLSLSHWLILPPGFALTFLLALYRRSFMSHWRRMERTVDERTAELRAHEQRLEDLVKERTESLSRKTALLEAITETSWDGILVTDSRGRNILGNKRLSKLWKADDSTDLQKEDEWAGFVASRVRNPHWFHEKALPLLSRPHESLRDEVELLDGTVLEIYSSAILGREETQYGRIWIFHDVTERKRAEEALRESEKMFRDLAEKSVLGISLIQDGHYRYVNAQFAAIRGQTVEEMTDKPASLEYIHPEDLQRLSEVIESEPSGGHAPMEFRIVAKQGEVRTVWAYASPTTHGGRPATVATLLDLTERRQAEEAVRENEVRLSHATNLAKIVYWEHDETRREFVFNDAFYALYGTTAKLEGGYRMGRDEYFRRFVHPEDVKETERKAGENRDRTRTPEELEHRVVRRDGSIIHIVTRMKLFSDPDGRVVKVIGANQDITERKGVEEALIWKTAFLEAQVNSSPDGILVVDRQGKTILRNQRMRDIWKHPREFVPGRDDRAQLEHDVSMTMFPQSFKEKVTFLHRHPDETSRDEVKLKDGTVLDVYSCPVLGKDGSHYGRIWTFRDVTELRRYWDMLESLSTTDGLTELPNRRRFDEFLNREWRRSMRDQSLLSLILMDIDFFKEFNDHYGHLAGDDCLRQVANVLSEIVRRPGDLAARYGGEEFACILPSTDLNGAMKIAHTVRDRLAETSIPHYYSSVADHVTLSFGVATLVPESGQTPSLLIQLADDLLYSAKQNGRDRILSWQRARSRQNARVK